MRVLPCCRTTGPRFALLKSYSFFILSPLSRSCLSRRNQASVLSTVGVNDDEKLACKVGAESHDALLVVRRSVVSRL